MSLRIKLTILGIVAVCLLWAAAFSQMPKVESATGPSWHELSPDAPLMTFDGDRHFVGRMADAVYVLDNAYLANYFFWWASEHGVTVRQMYEECPTDDSIPNCRMAFSPLEVYIDLPTHTMYIGYGLALEDAANAALLVWGIMGIRDYHEMGECMTPWTQLRMSATAWALSDGPDYLDVQSDWLVEWFWVDYRYWERLADAVGHIPEITTTDENGVTRSLCDGWREPDYAK